MLKIGLFSKLSRVSIRMLRYYDEIGLLHPAYTDPESEYRYYREDQLPQIGWITSPTFSSKLFGRVSVSSE